MKISWKIAAAAAILAVPTTLGAQSTAPAGFTSMFDGKTLKGWNGDMSVWSVQDGAITVDTSTPIKANTFLVYSKQYGNFELRFKYRWSTDVGNSGFQLRSGMAEGNFTMAGYQANVVPLGGPPERFGMLYNELVDRQEEALLGQRVTLTRRTATNGGTARVVRTVHEMVNSRDAILGAVHPKGEWNEVVVIAYGNRIISAINGMMAFDAVDKDPIHFENGLFGLQAHSGPAMKVQYKDIYVKPLTAMPRWEGRFKSTPTPAPAPSQTYKDSTRAALPDVALPQ
ncbi:MAG: DUF1080 domain-containing protein [Sphingomonadaceae bacterium]|nr:DUF1080 domain-containing protein [Sphingomonadaceae bacterium]